MKNLFVEYIKTNDLYRQSEYEYCLKRNIESNLFDNIYVITQYELPVINYNVYILPLFGYRTNYQNIFDLPEASNSDDLNFISNSDIWFDETINLLTNKITNEIAIGLSRHYPEDDYYFINGFHHDGKAAPESNDVWCWKGKCRVQNAKFPVGYYACDGRIMQCFVEAGYRVYNPAKDVKIWHKHKYRSGHNPPTVPGPYWKGPVEHHSLEEVL